MIIFTSATAGTAASPGAAGDAAGAGAGAEGGAAAVAGAQAGPEGLAGILNSDPLVAALVFGVLITPALWRIFTRAGVPAFWSLTGLIPFVGLAVALAILFRAEWKNVPRLMGEKG